MKINESTFVNLKGSLTCLILSLCIVTSAISQGDKNDTQNLFQEILMMDSLVFIVGYNQCDTVQLRKLLSDDLEFYHDKDGFLDSKEFLIQNIPNLCNMPYKATRVLDVGTVEVFPLYSRGELYGAIQNGVHQFYGEEEGKAKYLTSTANFTHVWIKENDDWKLKRILSFNHVVPEN